MDAIFCIERVVVTRTWTELIIAPVSKREDDGAVERDEPPARERVVQLLDAVILVPGNGFVAFVVDSLRIPPIERQV